MGKLLLTASLALLLTAPAIAQETSSPAIHTVPAANAASIAPVHGMALHGAPKYAADFRHLDYVNPDAPKGGTLRMSAVGTFDSLNGYIIKGSPASGLGMIHETLLQQTEDEPFSAYGLLAESIEVPADRSWIIFNLRPEAKWHDGQPVTADDVVWSFNTLTTEGAPFYKGYYNNVKTVEALSPARVKFTFDMAGNLELPLIVGQMPVLPKHFYTNGINAFEESTLTPPLGSGAYKIGKVTPGRSIEYDRVNDWWGKDLPINRGKYNFDKVTYEYFRDSNVLLEAFFADQFDFRQENTAKLWATAYDAPAVKDGRIIKKTIDHKLPQGFQGFIYNTRRPLFQDRAVREAIGYAFDYEWSNKSLAYDSYKRTRSFFSNSEMEASGLPAGRELEILEPFRDKLPPEVFTTEFNPPKTDGSGNNRANLKKAADILDAAGWKVGSDGIRTKDGRRLEFEFIDDNPMFERWVMPFTKNLEKIGVKANYRAIDPAQYQNRLNNYDFDMTVGLFGQSNSPGNEQREFWGSAVADVPGGRNIIGVRDPVVDELIKLIVSAPSREELVVRCRALDRVLQWGFYGIPNWHMPAWRIAYWDRFGAPARNPEFGLPVAETWWTK
ncbi:MAG: ABC transporter substrate-binding protein [Micavibrio aeruginosavorus]|uniref:ABC transporter substrate-binding protein n=1 Tax=Micavibrio aeruginosavorus TaxID=349221 RepID=A0A7T5UIY5_9BACT|nr:MAG: ABC transporter substrate-binding protein [Micavibrio aeruginosavorus]